MKKAALFLTVAMAALLAGLSTLESAASPAPPPTPKRINRAIELLEAGQPIYYSQISSTDVDYEKGNAKKREDQAEASPGTEQATLESEYLINVQE